MSIEDNLKRLMALKSGSIRAFSIDADIPYTTTRSILERGVMKANVENIFKIANHLGMTPEQIAELDKNDSYINKILEASIKLVESRQKKVYIYAEDQLEEQNKESIPIQPIKLHSVLSAGTGIVDLDPHHYEEIDFNGYVPKHDLAFIVRGNSMTPTFEDGEVIFVERTPDIRSGQIIAIQINEEAYIKKVYIDDSTLRLVSLNKEYKDIIADRNDSIRVIGRVIL